MRCYLCVLLSPVFGFAGWTQLFGTVTAIVMVLAMENKSGRIVNIASVLGYRPLSYVGAYSATKGALGLTTEALRMELKEFNVKLCNVAPGDFATNIASGRYHAPLSPTSPYANNYGKSLALMDEHVDQGLNPEIMGEAIYKIIKTPNPDVNYKVGAFMQKISIFLKGVLPGKIYERLLLNHYKL